MIQRTESESLIRRSSSTETDGTVAKSSRSSRRRTDRQKSRSRRNQRRLSVEGLEARQLLAAGVGGGATTPTIDPGLFDAVEPRNIGAVQAFQVNENENTSQRGINDTFNSAQAIPLGTGSGEEDTIDINGSLPITVSSQGNINTDVDTFSFQLRAGDILDVAVLGAGANVTLFYGAPDPNAPAGDAPHPRANAGSLWFGTDTNQGIFHPDASPLMTVGNALGHQVVPHSGTYYLSLAPSTTAVNYTAGLRVYRPVSEQLPIGQQQTIYVDFEGGAYPSSLFGPNDVLGFSLIRFTNFRQNIGFLGIEDTDEAAYNELIDKIISQIESDFDSVVRDGGNGDYDSTGKPGDFGIRILNSRDAVDRGLYDVPSLDDPLVTRIFVGGTVLDAGIDGILGIAQSLDVGNFDMSEYSILPIDFFLDASTVFPIANTSSVLDAVARRIGTTVSHEAGHTFGLRHLNGDNFIGAIMDDPGVRRDEFRLGVGPDGIFGTIDDTTSVFARDQLSLNEGLFGYQDSPDTLAHSLSTGMVGASISGLVFNDANRDGQASGDAGLPGVTVFADVNNNGIFDVTDPSDVSDSGGAYALSVASGTYNIIAITPDQFAATTVTTRANITSGTAGVNFGFIQVVPDITGTKFADTNGNGLFDANESGIEGVYVYLDLDGDDRPDLGEPSALTDANGDYSINFPGPGTYTIREVVTAGYVQTFPVGGEHVVTYNGTALTDNYNFGNLPSRDYGDAPDSYQTTVATNGPSHGISQGLGLGAQVDRETNGLPTSNALGDDNNNIDDEDGIQLLSPLGPGGSATFAVTTRNESGVPAFLQGWIDFDASGTFDANEQVFTNVSLGAGTTNLTVNVPTGAVVGSTYARFRYSPTANLGVGGEADVGEVEDYQFDILAQAQVANDDVFTVSRNSLSNQLDVLANDFETNVTRLTIIQLNTVNTAGVVGISQDGRSISYTPPNGFIGRDAFQYVVQDQLGNRYTANVAVNVNFQSNVPIAVDDTFDIPQGSANRALNVLDNDVPSVAGGLRITSVTAGDQGGQVSLEGGGQTVRYTPQPGFAGTEQFTYSIEDANGTVSSAQVTVNSQPGARNDDLIDFSIGIFDVVNNQPITSVQVGQPFYVRVSVQELNNPTFSPEGVASAFLDLLYTDELVATRDTNNSDGFDFDITFGDNFQGSGFKLGDASTPGLIDDVGAVQPIPADGNLIEHSDPVELFTITMQAVSPGVALFAGDPADQAVAETILVDEDVALTPAQQRLGRTELTIFPAGDDFASAIDDAFMTGTDSNGIVISSGNAPNTLDVLNNDNFGPTGGIREFGIATGASRGTAVINDNGTPDDLSDDTIDYYADLNANGFDSFTYLIVSNDGVRSVAEVTMAIGNAAADDIVDISFGLVDQFGSTITSVQAGQTFGVQVYVEDLRGTLDNTAVFAAYLDMLYDIDAISPAAGVPGGRYDFDVEFDTDFDAAAGVGTAIRDGIIDEFGSLLMQGSQIVDPDSIIEPNLMATVYFVAGNVAGTTQVIGSPADSQPFQDTLLLERNDPVPVSQIRYDVLNITITGGSPLQNPALPEDVNNDGVVTPSDALSVINALAREGEGESGGRGFFTDVNGDSKTTALDALRVINHLAVALTASTSESESIGSALLPGIPASEDEDSDDGSHQTAFAQLNQQSKLVSGEVAGGEAATSSAFLSLDDADEDEDDLLSLLADDQSSLL
ncbi:Ig-like domain-containing protein [Stieleria sp. TO1_6]|uniref:Ig-like domain-containing protein n=1 Tax=Stieleria tagensis TaxID=2956795 RepID=UPI00209A868F|nr:Ig-like domain-containing protein [Stieleria tagensis]MCO8121961.1 Ig-like domain-containing protein [Stieleria tagensis]